MPLDRAWADEQLGADLRVRTPLTSESGDLRLLRGEHVARLDGVLAHRLASGQQHNQAETWVRQTRGAAHVIGATPGENHPT